MQDPLRFRATFCARSIAEIVVGSKGEILIDRVEAIRDELRRKPHLIGPCYEEDGYIFAHILGCLNEIIDKPQIVKKLRSFGVPVCNRLAEGILRQTLWPATVKTIELRHLILGVLSAWFTWLRQITGSCFATAPAILVQKLQPLQFLQDLQDLLTKGSLDRIVDGKGCTVPLCPSTLHSDLLRPLPPKSLVPYSPGLQAAFKVAGVIENDDPADWLRTRIEKYVDAQTPLDLIEKVLLAVLGLDPDDVEEEKQAERLQMDLLLAKQSAVYYQRQSPRSKQVSEWKEKVSIALNAYQALADCALLRAWESTIASLSDVKLEFARWNLYVSLGMHPDEPSGISRFLYQLIDEKLQTTNKQLRVLAAEYESKARAAQALEVMFHRSFNDMQRQQIKSEWMSAVYGAESAKKEIELLSSKGEELSSLFSFMIQSYDKSLSELFQEIFDPSLVRNTDEMIDDSPAGFRLAFKHGRMSAAVWTFIRSEQAFIESLTEAFSLVEQEMVRNLPKQEEEIHEFSKRLIHYVQTDEFLKGALSRSRANPAIGGDYKKPWEYISGGTINGLMSAYYNKKEPFTLHQKSIGSVEELISFIYECRRQSTDPLFMHSPTHAFVFLPERMDDDPARTIGKMRNFWADKFLSADEEEFLAARFAEKLKPEERPLFLHRQRQKGHAGLLREFRNHLIDDDLTRIERVDSFIYESIPVLNQSICEQIVQDFPFLEVSLEPKAFRTPIMLHEEISSFYKGALFPFDFDRMFAESLRKRHFAPAQPIFFGDTNWTAGQFAIAVSPDGQLDLWRMSRTGLRGHSMRAWFYFRQRGAWACFVRPAEWSLD